MPRYTHEEIVRFERLDARITKAQEQLRALRFSARFGASKQVRAEIADADREVADAIAAYYEGFVDADYSGSATRERIDGIRALRDLKPCPWG